MPVRNGHALIPRMTGAPRLRHQIIASSIGLPFPAPVLASSHRPALIGWRKAAALANIAAVAIIHRLPVTALIASVSSHDDTRLIDNRQANRQSARMRDWRTPKQELEDQRSRRGLRLEAWGMGLALAVLLLVMARELFKW